MNRRNFLRGLMFGSVAAPIAVIAKVSEEINKPIENEPEMSSTTIQMSHYKEFDEPPCGLNKNSTFVRQTYTEEMPNTKVNIGVGADGHLYAKTNGTWKKLA